MWKYIFFIAGLALTLGRCSHEQRREVDAAPVPATIAELAREPARFDGRLVRVSGLVGNRLTLAGFGGFELASAEGLGSVFVAAVQTPPQMGAPVAVTGRFTTLPAAGAVSVTLIREELQ